MKSWHGMATAAVQLVYPEVCAICRRERPGDPYGWCAGCMEQLSAVPAPGCRGCGGALDGVLEICAECIRYARPWEDAVTVYGFDGLARQLIHRFKYQGDVALARGLGLAAVAAWQARRHGGEPVDAIVPVPLHWFRQLRRGYNQAALLAREFSRQTEVPVVEALRRERYTRAQAGLNLQQRLRNLKRAFRVSPRFDFAGKRVLLCDDVLTTGATLKACAERILDADAAAVEVLTIARG